MSRPYQESDYPIVLDAIKQAEALGLTDVACALQTNGIKWDNKCPLIEKAILRAYDEVRIPARTAILQKVLDVVPDKAHWTPYDKYEATNWLWVMLEPTSYKATIFSTEGAIKRAAWLLGYKTSGHMWYEALKELERFAKKQAKYMGYEELRHALENYNAKS